MENSSEKMLAELKKLKQQIEGLLEKKKGFLLSYFLVRDHSQGTVNFSSGSLPETFKVTSESC